MTSPHCSSSESSKHKDIFARLLQRLPPGVSTVVGAEALWKFGRGDDGTVFVADGGLSAPKLSAKSATESLFKDWSAGTLDCLLSTCGDGLVGVDWPSSTRSAADDAEFPHLRWEKETRVRIGWMLMPIIGNWFSHLVMLFQKSNIGVYLWWKDEKGYNWVRTYQLWSCSIDSLITRIGVRLTLNPK